MSYRQILEQLPKEWQLPVHPDPLIDEEQCRARVGLYRALVGATEESRPWSLQVGEHPVSCSHCGLTT